MLAAMTRDADATRARLLKAARREFAEYGIAGARVDRIAADADSNKAQIYHYFGSKDQLFDAVFASVVEQVVSEIPIDVDDLPGYAARLAQGYERHPEVMRLATWQRLERSGELPLAAAVEATKTKIDLIAQAQADGRVSSRYPADVLLTALLHVSAMWSVTNPEVVSASKPLSADTRQRVVMQIVRDLLGS
jgi:AcrR family transcriptional regulator